MVNCDNNMDYYNGNNDDSEKKPSTKQINNFQNKH